MRGWFTSILCVSGNSKNKSHHKSGAHIFQTILKQTRVICLLTEDSISKYINCVDCRKMSFRNKFRSYRRTSRIYKEQ